MFIGPAPCFPTEFLWASQISAFFIYVYLLPRALAPGLNYRNDVFLPLAFCVQNPLSIKLTMYYICLPGLIKAVDFGKKLYRRETSMSFKGVTTLFRGPFRVLLIAYSPRCQLIECILRIETIKWLTNYTSFMGKSFDLPQLSNWCDILVDMYFQITIGQYFMEQEFDAQDFILILDVLSYASYMHKRMKQPMSSLYSRFSASPAEPKTGKTD